MLCVRNNPSGGTETPDGGATETCTHPEASKSWVKIDDNNHKQVCSCGDTIVASEAHVYDDDNDTTCNKCPHTRTVTPPACTHPEAKLSWEKIDDNNHKQVCECGDTIVVSEAHVYDDDNDTTCNKCDYERTIIDVEDGKDISAPVANSATHTHTFKTVNGNKECIDCGVTFATTTVGSKVTFGSYQNEKIEWTILEVKNGKALVVANKILDAGKYHATSNTYAGSDVDAFLNSTFKTNAFSEAQQNAIFTSVLGDNGETERSIFLLSKDEITEYDYLISKTLTPYAAAQANHSGAVANGAWWWWTRTPSDVTDKVQRVSSGAEVKPEYASFTTGGIVPAMWITLNGEDYSCDKHGHDWDNGKCSYCEAECAHENESGHNCSKCGGFIAHTFTYDTDKAYSVCECGVAMAGTSVGSKVTFGNYQNEEITWTVLEVKDGKALIVADKILGISSYDDIDAWFAAFKTSAFNNKQISVIANGEIFALSNEYYSAVSDLGLNRKQPTASANEEINSSLTDGQYWWWWLNPADSSVKAYSDSNKVANRVDGQGRPHTIVTSSATGGVVPAMWIHIAGNCVSHFYGEDSKCTICGDVCQHTAYNTEYKCAACGAACPNTANHDANVKCTVCGFGCSHIAGTTWVSINETQHQKECNDCHNLIGEAVAHDFGADSKCDTCQHDCVHFGGEADCTSKAVCEYCGKPYGETNDTHKGEIEWVANGDKHQQKYSGCGHTVGEAEDHTYVDGKCSVCEAACGVDHNSLTTHNCSKCGAFVKHAYTTTDGVVKTCDCGVSTATTVEVGSKVTFGNYNNEEITWTVLEVENGKAFIVSDKILARDTFNGADAWLDSFKADAFNAKQISVIVDGKVSLLSNSYYDDVVALGLNKKSDTTAWWWWLNPDDATVTFEGSDGNTYVANRVKIDGSKHYTKLIDSDVGGIVPAMWIYIGGDCDAHFYGEDSVCDLCGYECKAHSFENSVCTICGYTCVEHSFNGDNKCDVCNYTCTSHVGGEATCEAKAICDNCGVAYGEKDVDKHTQEPTCVSVDATNHKYTYACCGATVNEAHSLVNGECSACDYACAHTGENGHDCSKCGAFIAHTFTYDADKAYSVCECGVAMAGTSVGSKVTFGNYQNEDITWTIIKVEGNKALVLADKVLDAKMFDDDITASYKDSDIRAWLNGEFITAAFTNAQKNVIQITEIDGDAEMQDKIFLLSKTEAAGLSNRVKSVTAYAATQYANNWWWLRSYTNNGTNNLVDRVKNDGTDHSQKSNNVGGIVPAMWINIAGDCATHFYGEDSKCNLCGVACAHENYNDGVCVECGLICQHTDKTWDTTHTQTCDVCGYEIVKNGTHVYGENSMCECGKLCAHENYNNGVCGDCGSTCPGHEFGGDSTCDVCGTVCDDHNDVATCEKAAICPICGVTYEAKNPNNHTKDATCEMVDSENHKYTYECCGKVVTEAHDVVDGECSACDYACDHFGEDGHDCSKCGAFIKHAYTTTDGVVKTCDCGVSTAVTVEVGSKVTFGSYQNEAITWTVLDVKDGKAFIVSDKILDAQKFDDTTNDFESSYIKNWLNTTFADAAFSKTQANVISGDILLLSTDDVDKYDHLITKSLTAYAAGKTTYAWWWLSTSAVNTNPNSPNVLAYAVKADASKYQGYPNNNVGGVVPAMWIYIDGDCAAHYYGDDSICDLCGYECVNHVEGTPATCTAQAICKNCGQSYGDVKHDFNTSKWVKIDENTHGHKCNNCGEFTDVTAHDTKEGATCTADDVCACGHVLEAKLGHSYTLKNDQYLKAEGANCQTADTYYYACANCGASSKGDTNTYYNGTEKGDHSYTVVNGYMGADGHADKCAYCDAHKTPVAHTSSGAATEAVAETCTKCGYVINAALGHTHTASSEWEYNTTYHWHDCVGNDGQEYNKAKHTFDDACDTTCNGGCGYVRAITHDNVLKTSETEHWYACSICGTEVSGSRAAHVWNGNKCECGYVCEHTLGAHDACDNCGVTTAHIFNNGACAGCEITMAGAEVGDNVTFGSYYQSNATEKEAITWKVLAVKDGKALIVADKILGRETFNGVGTWLDSFKADAFNAKQISVIVDGEVSLLSNSYYDDVVALGLNQKSDTTDTAWWWWLNPDDATVTFAGSDGNTYTVNRVKIDGSKHYTSKLDSDIGGIVPAMWIDLNGVCEAHIFGDDSVCDICGDECNHDDLTAHVCADCGYINHDYTTVDGETTCATCGVSFNGTNVGDSVTFGSYQGEEITWTIIDVDENGRALVVADKILDAMMFDDDITASYKDSDVRAWLNGEFVNSAFTDDQSSIILTTEIDGDAEMQDEVFLLSKTEAAGLSERVKSVTDYAGTQYANNWWWLRSYTNNGTNNLVDRVKNDGTDHAQKGNQVGGIVPAMWIQL